MLLRHLLLGLGVLLVASGLSVRGFAQDPADEGAEVLEAEELGVSLARIQRRLDQLPDETDPNVLRLNFYVQVYGRAPTQDFFEGFDLHNSPVPYGVPVHSQMMAVMRPRTVYPPAIQVNPVAGWAWRSLRP